MSEENTFLTGVKLPINSDMPPITERSEMPTSITRVMRNMGYVQPPSPTTVSGSIIQKQKAEEEKKAMIEERKRQ